jgi:GT2 family glycosyltransferase
MELAIIILNWNAADDTIRCIRRITPWQRLRPTIWVVDNASTDDSTRAIERECPEVHLIHNSANLGFAGGNNRGIMQALSSATEGMPILLLNNDAWIEETDVITLLETLPGTVIVGRAQVFHRVGLLDEDYFFSSEVADLCLRARQRGYLSAIDTRVKAFHDLGRSSVLRETLHAYYIVRNRFLLIRKFHQKRKILLYGFWTLYSVALSMKVQLSGKRSTARAVRLGLLDGLQGRFGGQNERVLAAVSGTVGQPSSRAGLSGP